jgi:glycosyltransferase involved in cell wall biosynthesis
MGSRMKLVAVGLRGIPSVQGGVETHAENLYPLLADSGVEVVVVGRHRYTRGGLHRGVRVVPLFAPRGTGTEALVHTLLGVIWAYRHGADVLHVHAIGPGLWVPLARLLGMRVLFTHHGQDYRREKWGRLARAALRLGEAAAVRMAHVVVAISHETQDHLRARHGVEAILIPNGVPVARRAADHAVLGQLGLQPERHIVTVGRLVPEKRQLDLVHAFAALRQEGTLDAGWRLVIVGSGDEASECVRRLRAEAARDGNVVLAGSRSGDELAALLESAALFCLPSSHEGLPIALLEALSYGLPVVASDIRANLEVGLPAGSYFPLGDVAALAHALHRGLLPANRSSHLRRERQEWVARRYSWPSAAEQTLGALRQCRGEVADRG